MIAWGYALSHYGKIIHTMEPVKLYIKPEPKPRMTQSDRWKKRPAVLRYRAFCDELRLLWGTKDVPAKLTLVFEIEMPGSWSEKKKQSMNGTPHQQRPDIDNYVKAFLDCLCEEDSYVYAIHAEKYWGRAPSIAVAELTTVRESLESKPVT